MGGQVDVGRGGVQVDRMRGGERKECFVGRKKVGGVSSIGIESHIGVSFTSSCRAYLLPR